MNKLPILLDENKVSEWAYRYCRFIKDDHEIRDFITNSGWAYSYCTFINNDPEIRKRTKDG